MLKTQSHGSRPSRPNLSTPAPGPGVQCHEEKKLETDEREDRLFKSLDFDNDQTMLPRDFERALADIGLQRDDKRLRESMAALEGYLEKLRAPDEERLKVPRRAFCQAVRHNILLIERALQGRMVVPDFSGFCREIGEIYDLARANRSGAPANYIPKLDLPEAEADSFGLSLCTIDGQRFSLGDSERFYSVQSTCKPINYCLALEEHGEETVHRFIGHEPSGASFNELTLNKDSQPHNPMINAGAIMSSALIKLSEKRQLAAVWLKTSGRSHRGAHFYCYGVTTCMMAES